jgi:hypothetical protein
MTDAEKQALNDEAMLKALVEILRKRKLISDEEAQAVLEA